MPPAPTPSHCARRCALPWRWLAAPGPMSSLRPAFGDEYRCRYEILGQGKRHHRADHPRQDRERADDASEILGRDRQPHRRRGLRHVLPRIEGIGHGYLALPITPSTYQSRSPILSPPKDSPSLSLTTPVLSVSGPVKGL